MSYKEKSPIPIVEGGTNATSMATTDGTVYFDGTRLVTTATGTAGQLLTSNGAGVAPTYQNAPAGGITTAAGDTGTATGSTVTWNANSNAGSTVKFSASGATVSLLVTDAVLTNTIMGKSSGNGSITGTSNTGFGYDILPGLTSGSENSFFGRQAGLSVSDGGQNTGVGYQSLDNMVHGSYNAALGWQAGQQLGGGGSDSSNIMLNAAGTTGDNNTLRVGAGTGSGNQQLNKAFISGINGVTVAGPLVNISSGDQLGVGTITSDALGRVTNTSQPAFSSYLSSGVTNVTGDGTDYLIICDTTLANQGSYYSTSTGLFTAPVAGLYQFNINIYWTNIGTGYINQYVVINGSNFYNLYFVGPTAAFSNQINLSGSILLPMNANDTAAMHAIGANTTKTMGINGSAGGGGTFFSGYLVC